jgi:hypothetical protein
MISYMNLMISYMTSEYNGAKIYASHHDSRAYHPAQTIASGEGPLGEGT